METTTNYPWADWLEAILAGRGLTILTAHERTGIARQTLYDWRDGKRPAIPSVIRLFDTLALSADERAAGLAAVHAAHRAAR